MSMDKRIKAQVEPFATDEECSTERVRLVARGVIKPATPEIKRAPQLELEPLPRGGRRANIHEIPEEGNYKCRKISGDEEYERRKRNYFVVLQSVLRSREEEDRKSVV